MSLLDRLTRLSRLGGDARRAAHTARVLAPLLPVAPAAAVSGITGLLRARARRHPDRPALRTPAVTLDYRALDDRVDRAARFWLKQGTGPGDVVALVMENSIGGIVHQLGLARTGATAFPVGPERRGPTLAHVLDAAAPRAIVVDEEGTEAIASLGRGAADPRGGIWSVDTGCGWPVVTLEPVEPRRIPDPLFGDEHPYLLLATSGTTGKPKAAQIPHRRALLAGAAFHLFAARLRPDDVVYTPLPLAHASAQLAGLGAALWAGACFAFSPAFSVSRYWSDAVRVGATVALYVGEIGRYLVDGPPDPDARRHSIRAFVGNGLAADVWPRLAARSGVDAIYEFYGATEGNTLLVNQTGKVGSCGRPVLPGALAGLFLARLGDGDLARDGRGRCVPCAPDEPGELLVRIGLDPMSRFDGYRDAEATAAKIATGVRRPGDRYFRTGDLLRRDRDGDYFFVDRLGDTFRFKGHNVSTRAVAEALGPAIEHPFAVYGVALPDREGRAGMVAIAGPVDLDALYAAAETLPRYARPALVRRVAALEHTPTGKVITTALREAGAATDDPLWVRLDDARCYSPLTPLLRRALDSGTLRL